MGRRPIFFDAEAFIRDVSNRFEKEDLIQDFLTFLSYVTKHKIKLTPKCRWIPMKHLYTINSLLKKPMQLDDKIGDKIYKTREERCAPRIYFIDLLAAASDCIVANKQDVLIHGPKYERFMSMDGFCKKRWLVLAWYFHIDWDNWVPEGDFGETLQTKALEMIPYLKEWQRTRGMIYLNKFANKLINDLGLTWGAQSQNHFKDNIKWGIKRCILQPLMYFDIIKPTYEKEDEYGFKDIKGFYVQPFGQIFLSVLIKTGEHIKNKPVQ